MEINKKGENTDQLKQLKNILRKKEIKRDKMVDYQNKIIPEYKTRVERLDREINKIRQRIKETEKMNKQEITNDISVVKEHTLVHLEDTLIKSIDLDIVLDAFALGGKGKYNCASVPVGRVFVLSHDYETFDQDGYSEVYLAGETVIKNPRRKDSDCEVAELAEFPGDIGFRANQFIAAVSQTEDDVAVFDLKIPIRLEDPVLVLRRSGGKWKTIEDRDNINKKVSDEINEWLEQFLRTKIQLWSGTESDVTNKIISAIDGMLKKWGLRVDTMGLQDLGFNILKPRSYPPLIYEIVAQLAHGEELLIEAYSKRQDEFYNESGLTAENLSTILATSKREVTGSGEGVFLVIKHGSNDLRNELSKWFEIQIGAITASNFIRDLYLQEPRPSQKNIRLTEQIIIAALRNPILGLGEWFEKGQMNP